MTAPRHPAQIRTNTRRPDRVTLVEATAAYKEARESVMDEEAVEHLVAARSQLCNAALAYVYGAKSKQGTP